MKLKGEALYFGGLLDEWAGSDRNTRAFSTGMAIARNRAVGFTSLLIGVASGMLLGLWSFGGPIPVPEAIGDYGDLPRRFLRLGHIAFFGLGLINLVLAGHYKRLGFGQDAGPRALALMNLGNLGLPPLLLAAAWQPMLLYLMPVPVFCVLAALALATAATWQNLGMMINRPQIGRNHEIP